MEVTLKECPFYWGHVTRSPRIDGAVKSLDKEFNYLQVAISGGVVEGTVAIVISLHRVAVQILCEMLDDGKMALCCGKMERSVSISIGNSRWTVVHSDEMFKWPHSAAQ